MTKDTMVSIETFVATMRSEIEKRLDALVPEENTPYNILFQAARYSLLGGGKRLRPLLTLAAAADCFQMNHNGDPYNTFNFHTALDSACAIEIIHTYSLIHDDLPCMDDDDFRRGKPSLHKVHGEAIAVLTGDYLLTKAFEVIAKDRLLTTEQKAAVTAKLAINAGGGGMVAGQVLDIAANEHTDLRKLEIIHRHKTGALITAAIEIGAIIGGATLMQSDLLQKFGSSVGLAFQIIDDILDVTKQRNSDLSNNKITYMTLLGKDEAEKKAAQLLSNADATITQLDCQGSLLGQLVDHLISRT